MLNKKLALLAAILLSVSGATAADQEESLWGYADPSADVVLYFNTKQPEKAMEKDVWERIQKDKNKALKEKGDDAMFDMKDRDMELIVNLKIASVTPFCGTIEGVANISGNLQGDIDKMMETMKQQEGEGEGSMPLPQISKKDDVNFYNLSLANDENTQNTDIMIVPVTPNQLQFRVNINPKDKMSQTLLTTAAAGTKTERPEGLAKLIGQDVAFACYMVPEKFADISLADTDSDTDSLEVVTDFLKKVSDISLSAQVAGPLTYLNGTFTFKSEPDAAAAAETVKEIMPALKSYFGTEQQAPRSEVNGKRLQLTFPVNTSDAWDMISRFTDENGSMEFFGIDPEDEDPKPTKVGNEKK